MATPTVNSSDVSTTSSDASSARTQLALRGQKLFDQAMNWIRVNGANFEKILGLLKESHQISLELYGEVDLKTARVAWQLASILLTRGMIEEAEPLLLSTQGTREQLLPDSSDELYDVYTDLSYVHMFRAQNGGGNASTAVFDSTHEYDTAMMFAEKAKAIVLRHANSSTSERFHYRLCLISSRIGGIQKAQGHLQAAEASLAEAYNTSARLQFDQEKNVKLHVHACLELAAITTQLQQSQATQKRKTKKESSSADPPLAAATSTRNAAELYAKAISLLEQHNLTELPFMAHAQAGLALLLMAEADQLHRDQTKPAASTPTSPTAASTTISTLTPKERHTKIHALLNQAVDLTTKAMQLYGTIGGENSPDVATMCYNLGSLHVRLDSISSARPFLSRALGIRTKIFGLTHESVQRVREDLAMLEGRRSSGDSTSSTNGAMTDRYSANPSPPSVSGSQTARPSVSKRASLPTPPAAPATPRTSRGRPMPQATRRATGATPTVPSTTSAPANGSEMISAPIKSPRPGMNRARTSAPSTTAVARGSAAAAVKTMKETKATITAALEEAMRTAAETASAKVEENLALAAMQLQTSSATPADHPLSVASVVQSNVAPDSSPTITLHKAPSQSKLLSFPPAVADQPASSTAQPATPGIDSATVTTPAAAESVPVASAESQPTAAGSVASNPSVESGPIRTLARSNSYVIRPASARARPKDTPITDPAPGEMVPTKVYVIQRSGSKAALESATQPTISASTITAPSTNESKHSTVTVAPTNGINAKRASGTYTIQMRPKSAFRPTVVGPVLAQPIPSVMQPTVSNVPSGDPQPQQVVPSPVAIDTKQEESKQMDAAINLNFVDPRFMSF